VVETTLAITTGMPSWIVARRAANSVAILLNGRKDWRARAGHPRRAHDRPAVDIGRARDDHPCPQAREPNASRTWCVASTLMASASVEFAHDCPGVSAPARW